MSSEINTSHDVLQRREELNDIQNVYQNKITRFESYDPENVVNHFKVFVMSALSLLSAFWMMLAKN